MQFSHRLVVWEDAARYPGAPGQPGRPRPIREATGQSGRPGRETRPIWEGPAGQAGDGRIAMSLSAQRRELVEAARVLSRLGLVTAYGQVSVRAGASMLITPAADLATVTESSVVDVPLDLLPDKPLDVPPGRPLDVPPGRPLPVLLPGPGLPAGAPAEAWAHLALYRMRPDARAIARAQPPGAFDAAAAVTAVPLVPGQGARL